jgi:myo-inositol-1-phosphate synthase
MKSPYTQRPDDQAREATEEFIEKHARTREAARLARKAKQRADRKVAAT